MEATELRIGNFVTGWSMNTETIMSIVESKTWDGGYYVITDINKTGIGAIKPIPLTEEWLIKFGFKRKEDIMYHYHYKYFMQTDTKGCQQKTKFSLGRNGTEVFIDDNWICGIKYVHQLQNLYFALTGKELSLKSANPISEQQLTNNIIHGVGLNKE